MITAKVEAAEGPATRKGIFSPLANFKSRLFVDYGEVKKLVHHCRGLGWRIVLTQGTYDLVHIGHARYLESAKSQGDFLIVGIDSDEKVRSRKGPERPVVPETERLEMLCHLRSVDAVFLKQLKQPKWGLIKAVRPDVLIATKETYDKKQLEALKKHCGEVLVLEPMAITSTSAKIRRLQIGTVDKLSQKLVPKLIQAIETSLEELRGK